MQGELGSHISQPHIMFASFSDGLIKRDIKVKKRSHRRQKGPTLWWHAGFRQYYSQ